MINLVVVREFDFDDPVYEAVCFHSQQCIEKYFKAVMQENEIEFGRTHDLNLLLEKIKNIIPELAEFKEALLEINSFAVEVRYPGILMEVDKEDAQNSSTIMKNIREITRKYFGIL
ncbi:MAG: HEPN domain-containing protein [Armatimonadetes bacterium]|nr:HEPN domain-containing protein [Armatimonadota bacterium]